MIPKVNLDSLNIRVADLHYTYMILEICANSLQSAKNAEKGGADRIELCTNLEVGGLTPSIDLIKATINTISIPVFVLIRPRPDNFTYTDDEITKMIHDIEHCKRHGCGGIVTGALTKDDNIDIENTLKLIEASKPLPFTFHRAFDRIRNTENALDSLIKLGVNRVLTSGQKNTAENGLKSLLQLKGLAKDNIIIMPGGGIRSLNAKLFKSNGFLELHSSAIIGEESAGGFFKDIPVSNLEEIRNIKSLIH